MNTLQIFALIGACLILAAAAGVFIWRTVKLIKLRQEFEKLAIGTQFIEREEEANKFQVERQLVFITRKGTSPDGKSQYVEYKFESSGYRGTMYWPWFRLLYTPTGLIVK